MSAPNIINVTSIYGKTVGLAVTTVSTNIVTNTASSGKVLKINALNIANVSGTFNGNIIVDFNRNSVSHKLSKDIVVPPRSSLIIIGKDIPIYLEEGDSLKVSANIDNYLEA